jgi:hypothetical protein
MARLRKAIPPANRAGKRRKATNADDRREGAQLVPKGDDAILLPLNPESDGTFLVLAETWDAAALPLEPLDLLSEPAREDLERRIVLGTGVANIGLQGLNGLQSVQGLVRLAPETLKLMQAGAQPLTSGGLNLGTLASEGRIVAQVRWLPATGPQAIGVLASLGPAIALAAIQFQLAAMEKKLDRIIRLTDALLRQTRTSVWTEVESAYTRLTVLWNEARQRGGVNDNVMTEARGKYDTLAHRRSHLMENVTTSTEALARIGTAAKRREWLGENGSDLFRDLQCLAVSSWGCQLYEAMRAQHVSQSDPLHAQLIYERAVEESRRDGEAIGRAMTRLTRVLSLIAADPGSKRWYMLGKDGAPADVLRSVKALSEAMEGLGIRVEPPLADKQTLQVRGRTPGPQPKALEAVPVLALHLDPGEVLKDVIAGKASYLCLTDERVYRSKDHEGTDCAWSIPWMDVTRVGVVEDWGDWNVAIFTNVGKEHKFELGGDKEDKGTAIRTKELLAVRAQARRSGRANPAP